MNETTEQKLARLEDKLDHLSSVVGRLINFMVDQTARTPTRPVMSDPDAVIGKGIAESLNEHKPLTTDHAQNTPPAAKCPACNDNGYCQGGRLDNDSLTIRCTACNKVPVPIGADGRCKCDVGDACPLGRMGMEYRCTEKELQAKGIKTARSRTKAEVLRLQRTPHRSCCNRFADQMGCSCLEEAVFDDSPVFGDRWKCPECGTVNGGKAAKCVGCGG